MNHCNVQWIPAYAGMTQYYHGEREQQSWIPTYSRKALPVIPALPPAIPAKLSPLFPRCPPPFPQSSPRYSRAAPRHSRTDLPAIPALPPAIPAKLSPVIPAKAGIHKGAPIIKQPVVYIMASKAKGTLYMGVTSNLKNRMWEHRIGCLAIQTRLTNIGNGSLQGVGHVPLCPTYEAKVE